MNPKRASIVESIAGRDAGKLFIVIDIMDDNHLLLADGKNRRIESPKKKKIKHLKECCPPLASIEERISDGTLSNSALRKALKEYSAGKNSL